MCTALDYRGVRIGENGALSSNTKPKPVRTARTLHSGRFWEFLTINYVRQTSILSTVKLGDKERFDKEQIGVQEPFFVTNCQFTP